MVTSSADPDRLAAYRGRFTDADQELTTLAADLDETMEAFAAGAGSYLPQGFDATSAGELTRGLRDESEHLGDWVASVGRAFREADLLGIPADQLDTFISKRVGEPTIAEAEQAAQGQQDAAALRGQLEALGIDPDGFDPAQLANLDPEDPTYTELFDLMTRIGDNMWSEDYATGFYDQMNAEGIRATVGVIETFAAHQVWSPGVPVPELGNIKEQLLDPFVLGFALASGSVDLSEEREALLNPGDDVNGDARWKQHQLSLLLSAEGHNYDPHFLAQAADVILVSNRDVNWINSDYGPNGSPYETDYPPLYIGPRLWDGDLELGVPQALALRALSDNTEASWQFADMGSDNLEAILRPDTYPVEDLPYGMSATGYEFEDAEQLKGLMEQYGADITTNAFIEAPMADPSRYDQALDNYADVVRIVGDGDIPDVTKRTVANAFGLYIDDIGEETVRQSETVYDDADAREAEDFNRPDLVDFFHELAFDEEAAAEVGESFTYWAEQRSVPFLTNPQMGEAEVNELYRPVSLLMGSTQDGFDAADEAARAAREGFALGARHVAAFGVNAVIGAVAGGAAGGPGGAAVGAGIAGTSGSGLLQLTDWYGSSAPGLEVDGNNMEVAVVEQMREDLAVAVATEHGWPLPEPGEYGATLARAFPEMDLVGRFDENVSDKQGDYDDDDHWSPR
jgi:hypothetical protein